jgi:hypothetical protein
MTQAAHDRIVALSETAERLPKRRRVLMREWLQLESVSQLD